MCSTVFRLIFIRKYIVMREKKKSHWNRRYTHYLKRMWEALILNWVMVITKPIFVFYEYWKNDHSYKISTIHSAIQGHYNIIQTCTKMVSSPEVLGDQQLQKFCHHNNIEAVSQQSILLNGRDLFWKDCKKKKKTNRKKW